MGNTTGLKFKDIHRMNSTVFLKMEKAITRRTVQVRCLKATVLLYTTSRINAGSWPEKLLQSSTLMLISCLSSTIFLNA